MKFSFSRMNESDAREVLAWRYDAPYDLYNPDPGELEKDVRELNDPNNSYHVVRDENGSILAFYCYGEQARVDGGDYSEDALDLGGASRPDLTGSGFGAAFIHLGMDLAEVVVAPTRFRVTIAAFNSRALRMCESAGFQRVQTFRGPQDTEFVVLTKDAGQVVSKDEDRADR